MSFEDLVMKSAKYGKFDIIMGIFILILTFILRYNNIINDLLFWIMLICSIILLIVSIIQIKAERKYLKDVHEHRMSQGVKIQCPNCGHLNHRRRKWCKKCRTHLV